MLSDAYFLAKFRFDTAENEPVKNLQNLQNFAKFANLQNRYRAPAARWESVSQGQVDEAEKVHRRASGRAAKRKANEKTERCRSRVAPADPFRKLDEKSDKSNAKRRGIIKRNRAAMHKDNSSLSYICSRDAS